MSSTARGPTLVHSYLLPAPVTTVFRALTEPSELVRWFLKEARLPPTPGAPYEFVWRGGYRHRAKVVAFVPNRKLTLEWPVKRLGATRVTFTLSPEKRGTRLRLRQTGFGTSPAWIDNFGGTNQGWGYFLMNLKSVLTNGTDLREPE